MLITTAPREAAATEQGGPIAKAVTGALKDRELLFPVPGLLTRLAMPARAAARRQAYRSLSGPEQPDEAVRGCLLSSVFFCSSTSNQADSRINL
ncbi:hypothetical protein NKI59_29825 [Mesorhizobium sp. M0598]|uniref:hypothetical protein n=1 Tax=Mesorhizobium sp. M0598 TaxID=2956968 RepID=UPI003335A03B